MSDHIFQWGELFERGGPFRGAVALVGTRCGRLHLRAACEYRQAVSVEVAGRVRKLCGVHGALALALVRLGAASKGDSLGTGVVAIDSGMAKV